MKLTGITLAIAWAISGCGFYCIEDDCGPVLASGKETRGFLVGTDSEGASGVVDDDFTLGDDGRVTLHLGTVAMSFRRPTEPGTFALAEHDAVVCGPSDRGAMCAPVSGELEVLVTAPACGDGACGALDLSLHVPPPETLPARPYVTGDARVLYREWREEACTSRRVGSDSAFAWRL